MYAIMTSSCEGGHDGMHSRALSPLQSDQVIKGSKTQAGKQRYKCQNMNCPPYLFQLDLTYKGLLPEVKAQIVDMALSGSGIRDTARVLKISTTTVIHELKKESSLSRVQTTAYWPCSTRMR
jgi:transposase-like protein